MRTNYVFIDFENVQVDSLTLLNGDHFKVKVFLGPNNKKLPRELVIAMHELGPRAEYITLEAHGSNALDFHISYYLGQAVSADPKGFYHIISKDTGFDPLIQHLKTKGIFSARSASIHEMPCIKPTAAIESAGTTSTKASSGLEALIDKAVEDLIRRKASKPRTVKTLRNTIHSVCGKELTQKQIDAVMSALVANGKVIVNGTKVSYKLA